MAYRNRMKRNGGNSHHRKPKCWYGEHAIRGKVWIWNGHPVCKRCHDICCKKLVSGRKLLERFQRASRPPQQKGFFARLFGW